MTRNVWSGIIIGVAFIVCCAANCQTQTKGSVPGYVPRGWQKVDNPPALSTQKVTASTAPGPLSLAQIRQGLHRIFGSEIYNMETAAINIETKAKILSYHIFITDTHAVVGNSIADITTSNMSVDDRLFSLNNPGVIDIALSNIAPGKQYLLDCSLGQDGTYTISDFFAGKINGVQVYQGYFTSFNKHLLSPLPVYPVTPGDNIESDIVSINYTGTFTFYGCQLMNVSQ
jgi:hypothetical protein